MDSIDERFEVETISSQDNFQEIIDSFNPSLIILEENYDFMNVNFLFSLLKNNSTFINAKKIILKDEKSNLSIKDSALKNESILIIDYDKIEKALEFIEKNSKENSSKSKNIIYISDNKFMHTVIGDLLKKYNFNIIHAYDGEEGINMVIEEIPDMILTDLDIPKKNGLEICHSLKSNPSTQNIPIVIYSSCEIDSIIKKCKDAGAKAFFKKNVNPSKFAEALEKILYEI